MLVVPSENYSTTCKKIIEYREKVYCHSFKKVKRTYYVDSNLACTADWLMKTKIVIVMQSEGDLGRCSHTGSEPQ